MKAITQLLFACLVIGATASHASAQSLWRESVLGQSVSEVSELFPAAAVPVKPGTLKSGAVELLTLDGVKVGNLDMPAHFYFKDGALTQVTLQLPETESNAAARVGYDSLLEALRAKYGQEFNSKNSAGFLTIRNATWMAGKTNITLTLMLVGDAPPILNVVYQVRLSDTIENL